MLKAFILILQVAYIFDMTEIGVFHILHLSVVIICFVNVFKKRVSRVDIWLKFCKMADIGLEHL